jgi:type IV secretion system protein VirB1
MIFTSENRSPRRALFLVIVGMFCGSAAAEDLALPQLLAKCAPTVAASTMSSIVQVESSGNVFAVADAGPVNLPWSVRKNMVRSFFPGSRQEAVDLVQSLLKKGHTVSLGLSQINDRNLKRLGLSVEQVFDPCTNLSAGGQILTDFYRKASQQFGAGERALQAAISAYNSGDWERGVSNGYVNEVYRAAGVVPALKVGGQEGTRRKSASAKATNAANGQSAEQWWASRAALLKEARESALTASME